MTSAADWESLKEEAYGAFSPGAPIKLKEDLSGRQEQAARLRRIVLSAGEHAMSSTESQTHVPKHR